MTPIEAINHACAVGPMAQITCNSHISRLKVLMRKTEMSDSDVILQPHITIPLLRNDYALSTQLANVGTIKSVFTHHPELKANNMAIFEVWQRYYHEVLGPVAQDAENNFPSAAQIAAYMPWAEVIEKRDGLNVDSPEYFILCLHTMLRPLRGDLGNVRILRAEPTEEDRRIGNCLVIRPGYMTLTLNEFKTQGKSFPQYNKLLPMDLMDVITRSLMKNPRDFLIVSPRTKEPYTNDNAYTKYVGRMFSNATKAGMGLNMMRHIYVSSLDITSMRGGELRQLANEMCHNTARQMMYRLIFLRPGEVEPPPPSC